MTVTITSSPGCGLWQGNNQSYAIRDVIGIYHTIIGIGYANQWFTRAIIGILTGCRAVKLKVTGSETALIALTVSGGDGNMVSLG